MFSEKNKVKSETNKQQNKISQGTELVGDVNGSGSFRVEGKLEGTLRTTGKVVIGKTGFIDGQLECENADIEGNFNGKLKIANTLSLKSTAKVEGNVEVRRLSVEPGADFNATCQMKEQVKTLDHEQSKSGKRQRKQQQA